MNYDDLKLWVERHGGYFASSGTRTHIYLIHSNSKLYAACGRGSKKQYTDEDVPGRLCDSCRNRILKIIERVEQ